MACVCLLLGARVANAETYETGWHFDLETDFNYDAIVDIDDLTELAANWLQTGYVSDSDGPGVDTNGDGIVNMIDFAELSIKWNKQANDTRIAVYASQETSEPGDESHPYKITHLTVHNESTAVPSTSYEIDWFKIERGINELNNGNPFNDWGTWTEIDPNFLICETTTPAYFIKPGENRSGLHVGITGMDLNEVIFEDAEVKAQTNTMEHKSLPVKVPLPKRK